MIVNSLRCYMPRTAHDHELRARVARKRLRKSLRSRSTSPTSPMVRSTSPLGEGASLRPEGCFMIVDSFAHIATETGHDHAVPYPVGASKGPG